MLVTKEQTFGFSIDFVVSNLNMSLARLTKIATTETGGRRAEVRSACKELAAVRDRLEALLG